jgi:leucyl-tRNA synthetase
VKTNAPVEIGSIEKMSKSKKNTVDPDDIIASYGADTARWFMLSDSPPERDVIWTEEGAQGRRPLRAACLAPRDEIAAEAAHANGVEPTGPLATAIRKAAHKALAAVEDDVERLRFNRCVAHIYELANALQDLLGQARKAGEPGSPAPGARRGAS